MAEHNFRWRYPNGRVGWTYPTQELAMFYKPPVEGLVLESSPNGGETWEPAATPGENHADD